MEYKRNATVPLILVLVLTVCGCAALASLLPKVIATIADAGMIIDTIEDFADAVFMTSPDPDAQTKVHAALEKTRAALNVTLRTATGAQNLTEKQASEAFADFRKAYEELLVVVAPLGVKQADDGVLSINAGLLVVPKPLALGGD